LVQIPECPILQGAGVKNAGHGRMLVRLIYTMPLCGELIPLSSSLRGWVYPRVCICSARNLRVRARVKAFQSASRADSLAISFLLFVDCGCCLDSREISRDTATGTAQPSPAQITAASASAFVRPSGPTSDSNWRIAPANVALLGLPFRFPLWPGLKSLPAAIFLCLSIAWLFLQSVLFRTDRKISLRYKEWRPSRTLIKRTRGGFGSPEPPAAPWSHVGAKLFLCD
jgi:hypothetical protein